MNDEIKEILNYLAFLEDIDTQKKVKKVADYITNLQQENERLNDILVHKPDEKIMLKTNDGKEFFIIQSERIDMQEELNKANMQLMTQLEDYKSRIEKAVEELELWQPKIETIKLERDYLLDILNGRSDE